VERDWIWGVERSSLKTKVLGALVAWVMRDAAARGEEADLVRARKGCGHSRISLVIWFVCGNRRGDSYSQGVESFGLFHDFFGEVVFRQKVYGGVMGELGACLSVVEAGDYFWKHVKLALEKRQNRSQGRKKRSSFDHLETLTGDRNASDQLSG
jgi:hypothetical protein